RPCGGKGSTYVEIKSERVMKTAHRRHHTAAARPRDLDRARTCHRSQIRGGAISDVQRLAARARDDESAQAARSVVDAQTRARRAGAMTDRELISVGFQPHGDGSLHSPARITLTPAGEFYRLTIAFPGGDVLTCHVAKVALKISKEVKPMNAAPHLVD